MCPSGSEILSIYETREGQHKPVELTLVLQVCVQARFCVMTELDLREKRNILTKAFLLRKLLLVVWNKKLPSKSYLICSLMKDSWIQLLFPVLSNMTMFERKAMFWHKSFACLSQIQYQSGGACKTNKSYRRQIRLHYRNGILSINANYQSASRPLCFVKTEPNCMCMYSFWYKALYMRCFR